MGLINFVPDGIANLDLFIIIWSRYITCKGVLHVHDKFWRILSFSIFNAYVVFFPRSIFDKCDGKCTELRSLFSVPKLIFLLSVSILGPKRLKWVFFIIFFINFCSLFFGFSYGGSLSKLWLSCPRSSLQVFVLNTWILCSWFWILWNGLFYYFVGVSLFAALGFLLYGGRCAI